MRLDSQEIRAGLDELLTLPEVSTTLGARFIIGQTKDYIRQLEGELRRAGFTDYNDQKETEE